MFDHPPYSLDMAPSDYHLFPEQKENEKSPFFVRRGGHCCPGHLVGRKIFWIFLSYLHKLEQWANKYIVLRGEYVEYPISSLFAVACFLPGRPRSYQHSFVHKGQSRSRQSSAEFPDMMPLITQRMNFIWADKINHRFLTSLQPVRSETQCHLSYRPQLVTIYNVNICFLHSARLFNDTLLYLKPACHRSFKLTKVCEMYQAQEKPSEFLL